MMPRALFLVSGLLSLAAPSFAADPPKVDVVVYGATPAGVMAAVAAGRHGHSVALIAINNHVGGVVSGGLVATDMGDPKTVGGLAGEFFKRVTQHYVETYGANSKQASVCNNGMRFEPSIGEKVFDQMLAGQPTVKVFKRLRYQSVSQDEAGRILSITVEDPVDRHAQTFAGDIFIDASYEGDVMAGAHVPYRVGREARAEYGEYLAGIGMGPKSIRGLGDHRTMAYNYRLSITSNTENRVLCPKPEDYDPTPFLREGQGIIERGLASFLDMYAGRERSAGPNEKYDSNWADFVGNSEGYADGDWTTRDRIASRQRNHTLSRLYYFQNDPSLPAAFREDAQKWGLPKDEFTDNGHFPFQLYIREARRMAGRYVLKEQDLTQDRWKAEGVATGGYGVDCHVVQHLLHEGKEIVEHTRHVACNNYDIPYGVLTPIEPENLLVPVCCSASHVAYCSLRMEPVYMMLGHASGDAAHLAVTGKTSVQKVEVPALRKLLIDEHAILDAGYQPQVRISVTPEHPRTGDRVVIKAIEGRLQDPIVEWAWNFDGTGVAQGSTAREVHVFDHEKTYTVSLVVKDRAGRKRLVTTEIPVGEAANHDVTMDDFEADEFGRWDGFYPDNLPNTPLRFSDIFTGPGIHRDVVRNGKKAQARLRFQPIIPVSGRYQLCLGFRPAKINATNVPVLVKHAKGNTKLSVDERTETTPLNFTPIGEFTFKAGDAGFVEITNGNTDGRVVVDGVRWVWVGG